MHGISLLDECVAIWQGGSIYIFLVYGLFCTLLWCACSKYVSCCHKPKFILFEPNYLLNFKWFLVFTMMNLINWKMKIHFTEHFSPNANTHTDTTYSISKLMSVFFSLCKIHKLLHELQRYASAVILNKKYFVQSNFWHLNLKFSSLSCRSWQILIEELLQMYVHM